MGLFVHCSSLVMLPYSSERFLFKSLFFKALTELCPWLHVSLTALFSKSTLSLSMLRCHCSPLCSKRLLFFCFFCYLLLCTDSDARTSSVHLHTAVLLHSGVQGEVQVQYTREVLLHNVFQVQPSTRRCLCELKLVLRCKEQHAAAARTPATALQSRAEAVSRESAASQGEPQRADPVQASCPPTTPENSRTTEVYLDR